MIYSYKPKFHNKYDQRMYETERVAAREKVSRMIAYGVFITLGALVVLAGIGFVWVSLT